MCGTHDAGLPATVATRNWAAAALEIWQLRSSSHRPVPDSGPWADSDNTHKPNNPAGRGTHHPGAPGGKIRNTSRIRNTSSNKPPTTPEACAATMMASAKHAPQRAELAEGANCRFSNIARGHAQVKGNLCYSTTYQKTKEIPIVINKLYC